MIPDHVHHELLNWARWLSLGKFAPDGYRLASAERDALRDSAYTDPDQKPQTLPNARQAERVHAIYQDRLTLNERRVVDAEYLHRNPLAEWGREIAARRLKMQTYQYEAHLRAATRLIEREFLA